MNRRHCIVLTLLFLIVSTAAFPRDRASAEPPAERPSSWSVTMAGTPTAGGGALPLTFHRASFEVDVLGPLAVGVLVQEFSNDTAVDVDAKYAGQPAPGIRVATIEVERDGEIEELTSTPTRPEYADLAEESSLPAPSAVGAPRRSRSFRPRRRP